MSRILALNYRGAQATFLASFVGDVGRRLMCRRPVCLGETLRTGATRSLRDRRLAGT